MCKWGQYKEIVLCKPNKFSKRTKVFVDYCIADVVQMLNDYGVQTTGCCCGHNKGVITISIDKNSYTINNVENLELILHKNKGDHK